MTNRFSIQAIFSAQDKMTAPVKRMGMQVNSFSKSLRNDFRNAQMRVDRMGSALGGLGGYLTAGAIIGFAKKSIDAFNQSAAAIANVEAGIKATNNQLGISSQQFQKMAADWQKVTIFEDDAILQNVTAQLQTFTNIGKDNFNEVQRAALDVTSKLKGINATGEDLKSTSIMLGKAMNDPARGMTALRRVGIQFDASTENLVKTMQRQGKMGEAQSVMLKEIQRQYGGTAEAIGKTDAGMEKMKLNAIGDQMETIGKNLVPIKSLLLSIVSTALKPIAAFFDFLMNNPIGNMILAAAIGWKAYSIAMTAAAVAQKLFNNLQTSGISKIQLIVAALAALVGIIIYVKKNWSNFSAGQKAAIVILGILIGVIGLVVVAINFWKIAQIALNIAMSANPVGLIIAAIVLLVGYIYLLWTRWDKMSNTMKVFGFFVALALGPLFALIYVLIAIIKYIQSNWSKIVEYFKPLAFAFKVMFNTIKKELQPIFESFSEVFTDIYDLVSTVWGLIGDVIFALFPDLEKNFSDSSWLDTFVAGIKSATSIIVAIIRQTTEAIRAMIDFTKSGISTIKGVAGGVADFFGIETGGKKEEPAVQTQRGQTAKQNNAGSRNEVIIRNDSNNQIENKGSRVQRGGSLNLRYSG